jgi:hypothetical protein
LKARELWLILLANIEVTNPVKKNTENILIKYEFTLNIGGP